LNGWQQKISGFIIFSEIFQKEKFLKFVKIRGKQRKKFENSSKTAKSSEKLAENFENSSKTASFHSFLNRWQQKISGFINF